MAKIYGENPAGACTADSVASTGVDSLRGRIEPLFQLLSAVETSPRLYVVIQCIDLRSHRIGPRNRATIRSSAPHPIIARPRSRMTRARYCDRALRLFHSRHFSVFPRSAIDRLRLRLSARRHLHPDGDRQAFRLVWRMGRHIPTHFLRLPLHRYSTCSLWSPISCLGPVVWVPPLISLIFGATAIVVAWLNIAKSRPVASAPHVSSRLCPANHGRAGHGGVRCTSP